jgi:hypothetical protein
MSDHHTHTIGDMGVAAVIADLTYKGWVVYRPVVAEHLAYDLVASRVVNGRIEFSTFQVKSMDSAQHLKYALGDFDFFALHLKAKNMVVYVPLSLAKDHGTSTMSIASFVGDSATHFWWYEDFLEPSHANRTKRRAKDFGVEVKPSQATIDAAAAATRKIFASDLKLKTLVWQMPMTKVGEELGVSANAVKKECIKRGIMLPDSNYWKRR